MVPSLPQLIYSNHYLTQQDNSLVCLMPGCKFSISIKQAKDYTCNKTDTSSMILNILTNEVKDLKQRVIEKFKQEITEKELVQKEAIESLTPLLNSQIKLNNPYDFLNIRASYIETAIDHSNQICPFTEENFVNDFRAKKYRDKSKLTCSISANDFKNEAVKGFLTQNFNKIKSFLETLLLKNIPNLEETRIILTTSGSIHVTLIMQNTNEFLIGESYKDYIQYTKTDIETGVNGSEAFHNLKTEAVTDIAMIKFKGLSYAAFNDITDTYINTWSGVNDFITIYDYRNNHHSAINISLTNLIDTERCEINIEKFKKILEKQDIQYDNLINEKPRKGMGYDVAKS